MCLHDDDDDEHCCARAEKLVLGWDGWDGNHVPPYEPETSRPGHRTLEGVVAGRVPRSRPVTRAGHCIFNFYFSLLLPGVQVCVW